VLQRIEKFCFQYADDFSRLGARSRECSDELGEFPTELTAVHRAYCELLEAELEREIRSFGFTMVEFVDLLRQCPTEETRTIRLIESMANFDVFCAMMEAAVQGRLLDL
jgi:hypothetical protein